VENHVHADSVLAPIASGLLRGIARRPWQKQSDSGSGPSHYSPLAVPVKHGILLALWRSRALLFEMGLLGIETGKSKVADSITSPVPAQGLFCAFSRPIGCLCKSLISMIIPDNSNSIFRDSDGRRKSAFNQSAGRNAACGVRGRRGAPTLPKAAWRRNACIIRISAHAKRP
jgi:hypothetical protein